MQHVTTPLHDLFEDAGDPGLEALAARIREETDALMTALDPALTRQWEASPVPKPRIDTAERASGVRTDPTADAVADGRRLAVRDVVRRAESVLQRNLVATRATRLALEDAVARYDGEA